MRVIKFKRPDDSLIVGGQTFNQSNITPARYDELLAIAPGFADHFDVIEEEKKKADDKPKAEKP